MKKVTKKRKKDYVTLEDLLRLPKGTPEDGAELLDAIREHRQVQRTLVKGRSARSTRS
jgi:hypothetical protein